MPLTAIRRTLRLTVATSLALVLAGCSDWLTDVERGGVEFASYRLAENGIHIGKMKQERATGGFACAADDWIYFYPDWTLKGCMLAQPHTVGPFTLPVGTWVMPEAERLVAALPDDMACGPYLCTGKGGTEGTPTTFDSAGRLRQFVPRHPTKVDRITCAATAQNPIKLHANGRLESCLAIVRVKVPGGASQPGKAIQLDETGRFIK